MEAIDMDQTREALADAVSQVLEVQAFMFAEEASALNAPCDTCWEATIAYTGAQRGCLSLILGADACRELAANVLGLDAEDVSEDEDARDALKELLNVVCGQFLTSRYGGEDVFQLSIPEVEAVSDLEWVIERDLPESLCLEVDGEPLLVHLSVGVTP